MKDESFSLYVIMMQPADTLFNLSIYMKAFVENKTYLEITDPNLFKKLDERLRRARQEEEEEEEEDIGEDSGGRGGMPFLKIIQINPVVEENKGVDLSVPSRPISGSSLPVTDFYLCAILDKKTLN